MSERLWKLPPSWAWAPFCDVATVELELVDAKRYPEATHIAPNHIESKTGVLLGAGTIAGDKVAGPQHRFHPGQVLYSKIRPYLAKAIVATCSGYCSSDMYPVRARVSADYLMNWLISPAFTERVSRDQSRTVLPKVNLVTLNRLPVPVPPANEQHRIARKVASVRGRSRRAKDALDAVPALLERMRQSILAAAFRGDLTADWRARHPDVEPASVLLERIRAERRARWEAAEGSRLAARGKPIGDDRWKDRYQSPEPASTEGLPGLPPGWCWATLDEVAFVVGGITKGQARRPGEVVRTVPYLRVANVQRGYLDLEEVKEIEATEAEIRELRLQPGDLLLNEGGDRDKLGRGWVWEGQIDECIHQNHVFRARPVLSELSPKYISNYANLHGQAYFVDKGKQSTNLASVSLSRLRRFPVALPPALEQRAISEEFDRRFKRVDALSDSAVGMRELVDSLDRAILAKAFRGELVPQDPTDEPADVMLARLRAQQPADEKPARKKKAR